MNCTDFQEKLNAYLDGELDSEQRSAMDQHKSECPVCQLVLENETKFDRILKNYIPKEKASYVLRESVVRQLPNREKRFFRQDIFTARSAPALAVAAVLVVFVVTQQTFRKDIFPVFSETIENHVEFLRGISPLEFRTENMAEALAWFQGKTDFAVAQPHIDMGKIKLVGGRIMHLKDRKTAYFLMEKDGYKISAFLTDLHNVALPKASSREGITTYGSRLVKTEKGYHTILCFHPEDGTACILVTDMPLEQLEKLIV